MVNDTLAKGNRYLSDYMVIWGSTMAEHAGPVINNGHEKLKENSRLYRTGASLLRNGFYESDFAQRMHKALGIAYDTSKSLMNEVLTLNDKYRQESMTDLEAMGKLDRQLSEIYSKKERDVVNQLFSNTGLGNLAIDQTIHDGVVSGEMTAKAAARKVGRDFTDEQIEKLDQVASYMVTGDTNTGAVNTIAVGVHSDRAKLYTTLKAMSMMEGAQDILVNMDPKLRDWMMGLALLNRKLNDEINERVNGVEGTDKLDSSEYNSGYDATYTMDIHDRNMEYKMVTKRDLRNSKNSKEHEWIVIKAPTDESYGMIARESHGAGYRSGAGLETNRFINGALLTQDNAATIQTELKRFDGDRALEKEWLDSNGIIREGTKFRMVIPNSVKTDSLYKINNAAHSLYRTYIHNKELIMSEGIRQILLERGTQTIESIKDMEKLEATLKKNHELGLTRERSEVAFFLRLDYNNPEFKDIQTFDGLMKEFPMIAQYYKEPEGLSTFNGFNRKIQLVKRGEAEILLGHKNFSIFGDTEHRTLAKWENLYKKLVIIAKQAMVVTAPMKLINDSITNIGLLGMMDVPITEIYSGYKNGFQHYKEYSEARTKMVELTMALRIADAKATLTGINTGLGKAREALAKHKAMMEKLEFNDAFNAGFVQSYSTNLVVKEFDTISGVQKSIDEVIDGWTHDEKGDPNKLFDAIKWWQSAGPGADAAIRAIGEKLGDKRAIGKELITLADRLKDKKMDKESVSRYLSDMIGAPSSEAVAYGSALMVVADAMAKYTLAKHLLKIENPNSGPKGKRSLYTKEEAYEKANETFIDYRPNMPSEITALSDYGVLMFPAYWMRVQKVLASLVLSHPITSLGSYAIEGALGMASQNVLNQNLYSKATNYTGLVHNPAEILQAPFTGITGLIQKLLE